MAVIGITYEEPKPDTYKSVCVSCLEDNEREEKVFDSGNFIKDWYQAMKFVINELLIPEKEIHLSHSSSVNHFITDGGNKSFDSAYLKVYDGGGAYLDYKYDYENEGFELFVPKGIKPTWKELKKMCDDNSD